MIVLFEDLPRFIVIQDSVYPSSGEAHLEFLDRGADIRVRWRFSVADKAVRQRWRTASASPVVWHVYPATLEHGPIVHIIAHRSVKIDESVIEWDGRRTTRLDRVDEMKFTRYGPTATIPAPSVRTASREGPIKFGSRGLPILEERRAQSELKAALERRNARSVKPIVVIYRVQDASLVPAFGGVASFHHSLGAGLLFQPRHGKSDEPIVIEADDPTAAKQKAQRIIAASRERDRVAEDLRQYGVKDAAYVVAPHPLGVAIRHVNDAYEVRIDIVNPYAPAAYAFEFATHSVVSVLKVHHTPNIAVRVRVEDDAFRKGFFTFEKVDNSPLAVPPQGSRLRVLTKEGWTLLTLEDPKIEALRFSLRMAIEVTIGELPIVGRLYDMAQFMYMCETGKDFFGDQVSAAELAIYGGLAAVGIAVGTPGLLRKLNARMARSFDEDMTDAVRTAFGQLSKELDEAKPGSRLAVETVGDDPLLMQLAALPESAHQPIANAVLLHAKGNLDLRAMLKEVDRILRMHAADSDSPIGHLILRRQLDDLLTPDGKSFRQPFLHHAYQTYLQRPGSRRMAPLQWVKGTRGWARAYLEARLGTKFGDLIDGAVRNGTVVTAPTLKQTLPYYDQMIAQGIQRYSVLAAIRAKIPKAVRDIFNDAYQLEHSVEQRFYTSLGLAPYGDEFSAKLDLMTVPVPRTRRTADILFELFTTKEGRKILYTQDTKTTFMRRRIPHGAEHLFTNQEIADLTVFTLRRLEADVVFPVEELVGDFLPLAAFKQTRVPVLARSLDDVPEALFDVANGWPQVIKVKGIWTIVNADEVKRARAARAKWAAEEEIRQVRAGVRPDYQYLKNGEPVDASEAEVIAPKPKKKD